MGEKRTGAIGCKGIPEADLYRGYTISHEAWYWEACKRPGKPYQIRVGIDSIEGGTAGEFAIVWHELAGSPSPRIELFSDAWWLLTHHVDLFLALGELSEDATPAMVVEVLDRLGFADTTKREEGE